MVVASLTGPADLTTDLQACLTPRAAQLRPVCWQDLLLCSSPSDDGPTAAVAAYALCVWRVCSETVERANPIAPVHAP